MTITPNSMNAAAAGSIFEAIKTRSLELAGIQSGIKDKIATGDFFDPKTGIEIGQDTALYSAFTSALTGTSKKVGETSEQANNKI